MKKATRQQTKDHNTNLVLSTIFAHETISRAGIARITQLTRTTVSDIVADLLSGGLVKEIGPGPSLGGKSPILLGLQPNSRYLIGLDLAFKRFRGAIVNLRGEIRFIVDQEIRGANGDAALAAVYEILDQLLAAPYKPLVGIGIGTPGLVNSNLGSIIDAVNLDWKNLPLARILQERYSLPTSVFNDSQAAAMGEFTFGRDYRPEGNLLVINARHGIGAGIIVEGKLFSGDGGGAGEIGHVVAVSEGGRRCRCGKSGCLETVASSQAVVQRLQELAADSPGLLKSTDPEGKITLETIQQAFLAGNPVVDEVVLDSARYLGQAVAGLVAALNIQKIILSGDMTRFGDRWQAEIEKSMKEMTFDRLAGDTRIEIGRLGQNAVILGASAMILNNQPLSLLKGV